MKRYRALTKESKEVKGCYIKVFGHHYIYDDSNKENWEGEWGGEGTTHDLLTMLLGFIEVLPETVSHFVCTGKNGKEIYSGDETNCGIAIAAFEDWVWAYRKRYSTYQWEIVYIGDIKLVKEKQ